LSPNNQQKLLIVAKQSTIENQVSTVSCQESTKTVDTRSTARVSTVFWHLPEFYFGRPQAL
jgi:hypothetical protein